VLTSHPLLALLSQFANPGLQEANWQVPDMHVAVALGMAQVWPQLPQLLVSVCVSTQPPLHTV
jgi:hypothetical protein